MLRGGTRRSTRRPHPRTLHLPGGHSWHCFLHQQEADALHAWTSRPTSNSEVVCEDAISDPFFLAIQDIVVSLELRARPEIRHVTARCRLSDGQAANFFTTKLYAAFPPPRHSPFSQAMMATYGVMV